MYQACIGQVWYLAQVSATLFLIIAIWCGLNAIAPAGMDRRGRGGARSRIPGAQYDHPCRAVLRAGAVDRRARRAAAPSAATCAGRRCSVSRCGWRSIRNWLFNHARFGDALDFGQEHLAEEGGNPRFAADFKQYGRFSLHYVPRNVWYYFLNPRLGPLGGPAAD